MPATKLPPAARTAAPAAVTLPSNVRMTLADVPAYAEAAAKLNELESEAGQLQSRQASLKTEWDNLADANPQFRSLTGLSMRNADAYAKAVAKLSGADVDQARSRFSEIHAELRKIDEDLAVVQQAIALQRPIFDRARTQASLVVCRALFPLHEPLARDVAEKFAAFVDAYETLREFALWVEAEGIAVCDPLNVSGINGLLGEGSRIAAQVGDWQMRLRRSGYDLTRRG